MNKQNREVKKVNKPYHVRGKMSGTPVLLGKYKTEKEAKKAIEIFLAKKFYFDIHIQNVEQIEEIKEQDFD